MAHLMKTGKMLWWYAGDGSGLAGFVFLGHCDRDQCMGALDSWVGFGLQTGNRGSLATNDGSGLLIAQKELCNGETVRHPLLKAAGGRDLAWGTQAHLNKPTLIATGRSSPFSRWRLLSPRSSSSACLFLPPEAGTIQHELRVAWFPAGADHGLKQPRFQHRMLSYTVSEFSFDASFGHSLERRIQERFLGKIKVFHGNWKIFYLHATGARGPLRIFGKRFSVEKARISEHRTFHLSHGSEARLRYRTNVFARSGQKKWLSLWKW